MTIPSSTAARSGRLLILLLFGLASVPDAGAIVTRHDRDDESYRALAAGYPAAVAILPDGAGTLIAPNFVVTAAHVAQGTLQRNPRVVVDGTEVAVARAYFPKEWNGHGPHDIALLELASPITNIPPAALYRGKEEVGQVLTFVGTGDTGTGRTGPHVMDGVMRAATNRVDSSDGEWIFFTFDEGESATEMEGVSGPGDSGGPAFLESDGKLYLAGVSSHSRNGKPGRYGTVEGYTRVSSYTDWIDTVVSGNSDDPGTAPGIGTHGTAGGGTAAKGGAPGKPGEKRVVVRGGGPAQSLADVESGVLIERYLSTYNSEEDEAMARFIDDHFSAAYRARKTKDELLGYYHRLLGDHVGTVTARGVVVASRDRVVLRVEGAKGREAEFHFTLDRDGRIDDMMVAIIDGAPSMNR